MASVSLSGVTRAFDTRGGGRGAQRLPGEPGPPPAAGRVLALDGVSLDVADGDSVAVLGPSGCGKTTLLRVIAGLEAPDGGTVRFDGEDVTLVGAQDRSIGMVFQSYALYPQMTSKRNLGFFFKMHRREPETDERVAAVCEIMGEGFAELLHRKPRELSGGQQQRVAIARCIIRHPRVFLFDEPLSNLDAKRRAQTRVEIRRLIRRFSVTSFYVTHDQTEAIAICDRLAVLRHGRLQQVGRFRDVYDRPANTFVAGFVGTPPMNLLPGTVERGGVRLREGGALLPCPLLAWRTPGAEVTAGIRPEALRLADEGEPALDARVLVSEPLIAERQHLVTCALIASAGASEPAAALVARLPVPDRPAPGTPLRLTFDPEQLHLFGPDGARLR